MLRVATPSQQQTSSNVKVKSSGLLAVAKTGEDVNLDIAKDLPMSPPPTPSDNDDDDDAKPPALPSVLSAPSDDDEDDDAKPPALPSVPPTDQLKVGWTEHIDSATNYPYWTNEETGESTWHKP